MRNLWWVLAVATLVWIGARSSASPYGALETAFDATAARPSGYSLAGWVEVPATTSSPSLAGIVESLAKSGHLQGTVRETVGVGYTRADLVDGVGGTTTTVAAERLTSGATYATILRTASTGFANLSGSIAWLKRDLRPYGRAHLSVTLEGLRSGPVGPNTAEEMAKAAFQAVGGTVTNAGSGGPVATVMGYTSQIRGGDRLHGVRVNLQVAVNDRQGPGSTAVLVGSPLINVTY